MKWDFQKVPIEASRGFFVPLGVFYFYPFLQEENHQPIPNVKEWSWPMLGSGPYGLRGALMEDIENEMPKMPV